MAVRVPASPTSWGTVNELSALAFWIVHKLSKLISLLNTIKQAPVPPTKVLHSSDYLLKCADEKSKQTTKNKRGVMGTGKKLKVKYAIQDETLNAGLGWNPDESEYCTADSLFESDQSLSTKLR